MGRWPRSPYQAHDAPADMPVLDRERAEHMALRLRRTALRAGIGNVDLLERAHALAMEPRHRGLDDDHDPRYLHPGRTALVALSDGGLRDPAALAASVLTETLSPSLRVTAEAVAAAGSPELADAWALRHDIPQPFDEGLAERLVTADPGVRVVALAEWLDQLRHLRPWADSGMMKQAAEVTASVYLPVARRTDEVLARRLDWWVRRVGPGLTASS